MLELILNVNLLATLMLKLKYDPNFIYLYSFVVFFQALFVCVDLVGFAP